MAALTQQALKDYVRGGVTAAPAGCVLLNITHNYLKANFMEIPFNLHWTISDVKDYVHQKTGTPQQFQVLTLDGQPLVDDSKKLGFYAPQTGSVLHCKDIDPNSNAADGWLEDVSLVKKYEMSDEDYAKRKNTYRAYKEEQKKKDPNWKSIYQKNAEKERAAKQAQLAAAGMVPKTFTVEEAQAKGKVGDRCEVYPGARRGTIRYVGLVPQIQSAEEHAWFGIEFDEPTGKNDGEIRGKRYFQTAPSSAGFVKPYMVKVGDFPEEDPFASDSEDEDEAKTEDIMEEL